jgi:hypothetical protein
MGILIFLLIRASLKTQLINDDKAFDSFYSKNTDWIYVIDQFYWSITYIQSALTNVKFALHCKLHWYKVQGK